MQPSRPAVAYFHHLLITGPDSSLVVAFPTCVRAARLGYAFTPTPALLGNRTDLRWSGWQNRRLTPWSWWWRFDHLARLLSVGVRSRPEGRRHIQSTNAPSAYLSRHRLPPSAVKDANPEAARPYQRIATDLRRAISCGALRPADQLPTVGQLRDRYQVSPGTASRAIAELEAEGLVSASRGRRAVVNPAPAE